MDATNLEEIRRELESPRNEVIQTVSGEALTAKYSFETFVVGKSNQFAHASALAVAERPCIYNPLFIAGKTGLGKTHLLKAIGFKVGQQNPNYKICYTSTQKFRDEVVVSIRHQTQHKLRDYYRQCDILLIDDIQFLSPALSSQDEFFHIFNALLDSGKQIVLASDRPPKEFHDVHERLISRFESGMVADIEAPELETRVAILKAKAEADSIALSDEVAYLIATYVKSNVRELEGSLTKLAGHAAIYNAPISTDLVRRVLQHYISEKQRIIQIEDIVAAVAQFYGVKSSDLRGPSRKASLAKARQVVMFFGRELGMLSATAIGNELGGRHHTTVLHGHEFIQSSMRTDGILKSQVAQIENLLLGR